MPELELYHNDMSSCSQKVRLILEEKNLTWNEFCNDRAEKNISYYKSSKKDTTNIKISSEISLEDFEKLESSKQVDFDTFLKDYLNAI